MDSKQTDENYSAEEAAERFEAALKGAMKVEHKPLKEKPKAKKAKARKAPARD